MSADRHGAAVHRLLPAPIHRAALRLAHRLRFVWWRLAGSDLHGCNVLVSSPAGEVLLVRHSYQSRDRWMLPGGGVKRNERAELAAVREVGEETGCRLSSSIEFGIDVEPLVGCRNHVHLVAAVTQDEPRPDGREVVEARFFPLDALPSAISGKALARIDRWREWRESQPAAFG